MTYPTTLEERIAATLWPNSGSLGPIYAGRISEVLTTLGPEIARLYGGGGSAWVKVLSAYPTYPEGEA